MRKYSLIPFVLMSLFLLVPPVLAQAEGGDAGLQQRIELARKMHEVRPMSVQIEQAIEALSMRYPEDRRELFVTKMLQMFDQQTLSEVSVKAMAETFTAAELQKMVEFYGSPEGKAIEQKMPVYQAIVEPEIIKKIDEAMMEIRTGAGGARP